MVPQPHGGALLPGAGGGPQPGSGRPPNAFRKALRDLVDREKVHKHLLAVLEAGPNHPQFLDVLKYTTEHGYGKAGQSLEVTGAEGGPVQTQVLIKVVQPDADG